ncbi:toxin-antitoxin system TumE family protein [Chromatium okenii]|uniref:Uncharacterized protein n=2 Tax=Chromatium okenii TaxID=61644 RepID=A0A2S7XT91_9GAMM|nr:DUF6516 family protein [Chromatium okenii]MBV5309493.1 hypothetical protein [Chromatium okenii]PQJ96954.1 hypothetical protein CXB77_04905 [Chromatium okenii]
MNDIQSKAISLLNRCERRDDGSSVHLVIWKLPTALLPCQHHFKYRLAYIVNGICVVRYDNERGKGDHRHVNGQEESYLFSTPEQLIRDFRADILRWKP